MQAYISAVMQAVEQSGQVVQSDVAQKTRVMDAPGTEVLLLELREGGETRGRALNDGGADIGQELEEDELDRAGEAQDAEELLRQIRGAPRRSR